MGIKSTGVYPSDKITAPLGPMSVMGVPDFFSSNNFANFARKSWGSDNHTEVDKSETLIGLSICNFIVRVVLAVVHSALEKAVDYFAVVEVVQVGFEE